MALIPCSNLPVVVSAFAGIEADSALAKSRGRRKQGYTVNTQTNGTPVLPAAVEAHATVVTEAPIVKAALSRFEGTFQLESEVVGVTRRKVSKKGAVTLSLLPLSAKDGPSLKTVSGKSGVELDAFRIEQLARFKGNTSALIGRITSSKEWNAKSLTMNPTGDRVSFVFEREEPEILVTENDALKALAKSRGVSVEKLVEALALVEPVPQPEDESGTGAGEPASNGAATVAK